MKAANTGRVRDLSETSITKLPTLGLQDLETLKLMDTFTLKVIPSIYNYKNIKTAFLTYSYHCCAFKFPASHDQVQAYEERVAEDMKRSV